MGIVDRLKKLTKRAEDSAAEHEDQIHEAVQKAEAAADQKTGGEYHDEIQKAGTKADALIDNLKPVDARPDPASEDTTEPPAPTHD
jgi:DNA-binding protein H-NS